MDVDTDQDTTIPNKNTPEQSQPHDEDDKSSLGSVSPAQQQQPPPQQNSLQSQQPAPGPRHAPTYSVVNAILEKKEDGPGPRCGHTLTAVAAVGEEGSPGYIGPRLILFGGATALEGNSGGGAGTPTSAGSAGISMLSSFAII